MFVLFWVCCLYRHVYIHLKRDSHYRLIQLLHGLIMFTLLEDRILPIKMVGAGYREQSPPISLPLPCTRNPHVDNSGTFAKALRANVSGNRWIYKDTRILTLNE